MNGRPINAPIIRVNPHNPGGPGVILNELARQLPYSRIQAGLYSFGELPAEIGLEGMTPHWEVVNFNLAARETQDNKISVKPDFILIALMGNSPQAAGYRLQLYDVQGKRRFSERGINFVLGLGAGTTTPFWLSRPYRFLGEDRQVLVRAMNQATVANLIQVVLYGVARRWNE